MRILITSKPGEIGLFSHPDPVASRPGEALVRVDRVGLCGADLHLFNGDGGTARKLYPRIQGHEVSGVVEQVAGPRNSRAVLGQRVAVVPTFSCGRCHPCSTGASSVCTRLQILGTHRDGALADRMVVPVGNLVPVAPHVPPDAAAFIEPMSIAVQAIRRSRVTVGEHVVVFGAGPLGQATCLAAQAAGAEVTLAEHAPGRHEWCGGEAPEVVIDTIGTPTALQHTLAVVAHGGRLVTVGQPERKLSHYAGLLTNREVDIVTVGCSTHEDLVQAARIVAASVPSILSLISHKVRLDEVEKVLPRVGNPETMKIVVDMSAG